MTADPILTLAWLILAHLGADFLLQTSGVVAAKTARGGRALRGFAVHALGVAICLVPVALAFGGPPLHQETHRECHRPDQSEDDEIIPVQAKKPVLPAEPRYGNEG